MTASPDPLQVDPAALKALAHPLRVQMYDLLEQHGAATASRLAGMVGESSGSTSYHLRQLAKHGFIEEDPERGTRRERWWRARPGGFRIEGSRFFGDPETADDLRTIGRELVRNYAGQLEQWFAEAGDWDQRWVRASIDSASRFDGTSEELAALRAEVFEVIERHVARARDRPPPEGSARIAVQFHAFPTRPADPERAPSSPSD